MQDGRHWRRSIAISQERKRKNSRTCVHRICTRPPSNYLISINSLPNPWRYKIYVIDLAAFFSTFISLDGVVCTLFYALARRFSRFSTHTRDNYHQTEIRLLKSSSPTKGEICQRDLSPPKGRRGMGHRYRAASPGTGNDARPPFASLPFAEKSANLAGSDIKTDEATVRTI